MFLWDYAVEWTLSQLSTPKIEIKFNIISLQGECRCNYFYGDTPHLV